MKSIPNESKEPEQSSASEDAKCFTNKSRFDEPPLRDGDLGKVQEILLGSVVRSNVAQLESLHREFSQQIARLTEDHSKEIAELRRELKEKQSALDQRIDQQDKQQRAGFAELATTLNSNKDVLSDKLNQITEESTRAQGQINDRLEQVSNQWSESLNTTQETLLARLDSATGDLESRKMDRQGLSVLLGKVADELSDDCQPASAQPEQVLQQSE